MDVKSGTTVGFVTVVGGLAGAIGGFVLVEVFALKKPERATQAAVVMGALTGAFIGGTIVASPAAAPTTALVAPVPVAALPAARYP